MLGPGAKASGDVADDLMGWPASQTLFRSRATAPLKGPAKGCIVAQLHKEGGDLKIVEVFMLPEPKNLPRLCQGHSDQKPGLSRERNSWSGRSARVGSAEGIWSHIWLPSGQNLRSALTRATQQLIMLKGCLVAASGLEPLTPAL